MPRFAHYCVCALFCACLVRAQTIADPITLPAVEVTGTRLGRPLEDSPINFTIVPREVLRDSGRVRLGEVLRELPEFGGNPIVETVAFNESRGTSGFDLRGLGVGTTLILVNGRRTTVNANAFEFTKTYVDLNRFSPAFIERIEILKGGASAVYGADAVGGVVNLITRRLPTGGELAVSYGNTFVTDAAEFAASASTGVTHGRLGLSVGLDWFQRHAQAHVDRPFTRSADYIARYTTAYDFYARLTPAALADYDGRQATSANARVTAAPGQVNGLNGVSVPGLAAGAAIASLPGTAGLAVATPNFATPYRGPTGGRFLAAATTTFVPPEDTRGDPNARSLYDWNRDIWTLPEASRLGATGRLDYEAPGFALFAEIAGGHNRSRTEYHSRAFSGLVPRTNPFNPFGIDVLIDWRIPDQERRRTLTEDDSFSGQFGVRSPAGATLRWETAASYSRDKYLDTTRGLYRASLVSAALAATDPARALNPFGGRDYRQPTALLDSVATEAWFGGTADLFTIDAQLSGKLLRLPAGPVQGAAFLEQRLEHYSAVSDAASRAGDIMGTGQSGADIAVSRRVGALAAELSLPLIGPAANEPRGPRFVVEAAARAERFSESFNSGAKPSLGIVARPAGDLTLRASVSRSFRAPSLPQLHSLQSDTYYNSVPDPRRPVALTGDDNDGPNVPRLVRQGGNPSLGPETGRTLQAGGTWALRRVAGFSVDATWFRYDIENVIANVGPIYVLDHEFDGLAALVHREPGSQTVVNRTNGSITIPSGPAGATTTVAPGQSAVVPGRLARVDVFIVNLSRQRLEGWDFGAHHTAQFAGARWQSAANVSYTDFKGAAYDRTQPINNEAGGAGSPRWRGRASLDWARANWSAGTTLVYTASSGQHDANSRYQKPYRTVQLRLAYTTSRESWLHGTKFAIGVDDVFNETPPLYLDHPVGFNTGMIPRPQGRFWRATVKQTW
jgi:iron complex outermembrane receptor protein